MGLLLFTFLFLYAFLFYICRGMMVGWDGWLVQDRSKSSRSQTVLRHPSCQQEGSSKSRDHGSWSLDQNSKTSKTRPPSGPDPQPAAQIPRRSPTKTRMKSFV